MNKWKFAYMLYVQHSISIILNEIIDNHGLFLFTATQSGQKPSKSQNIFLLLDFSI